MPENENYHGSRIVNDKVFQKYVKKNTKKYGKSIVKIRISCYDVQEIELIHFLFAEEGCFTSFI